MASTRTHVIEADYDGVERLRIAALLAASDVERGYAPDESAAFDGWAKMLRSALVRQAVRRQIRP